VYPLSSEDEPVNHPRRYVDPLPPPPPTKSLEVAAQNAHMRQMRAILLPALHNVVRRVVFDCALDADEVETALDRTRAGCVRNPLDPAMRAVRMSLADVVCNLREEDVWFDGTDWNISREIAAGGLTGAATLFGTRRSPTIAVMPVMDAPRRIHPIPYVPETITHLPPRSLEVLGTVRSFLFQIEFHEYRQFPSCGARPVRHCIIVFATSANAQPQHSRGRQLLPHRPSKLRKSLPRRR
jgi:hypothetical protein